MLTRKFTTKVAQNLGRVLSSKIFKYKNIVVEVINNSETYAYINFIDALCQKDTKYICRINIYENSYILLGSPNWNSSHIHAKNLIIDRCKIYRWLDKVIKDYRICNRSII